MAGSVTEAQSHDADIWVECTARECNRGKEEKWEWVHGNTSRRTGATGAWLHGLLECGLGHGKVITKLMINPFVNGIRLVLNSL